MTDGDAVAVEQVVLRTVVPAGVAILAINGAASQPTMLGVFLFMAVGVLALFVAFNQAIKMADNRLNELAEDVVGYE